MRGVLAVGVVGAILAGTVSVDAGSKWVRVRTRHFLLVGDAGEREIRKAGPRGSWLW